MNNKTSKIDYWLRQTLILLLVFVVGFVTNYFYTPTSHLNVAGQAVEQVYPYEKEKEIIELVNKERVTNGGTELTENSLLKQAAYIRALQMIDYGYFGHIEPGKDSNEVITVLDQIGYKYQRFGENLAENHTEKSVIKGWLDSSSHRELMLSNDVTETGVAFVASSKGVIIVQLFGKPL